ncbi:MAG: 2,3-bisphosphoglycerate-independent phosphoglycerate mutase [Bacteroidia bacterium]|nr:2,3-bisphosphoglycerate-independent phosphoglycerate mutase [Bacteroidia bacterium]
MKNTAKLILIIMDGWGIAEDKSVSAIDNARTPFYNHILETHSHTKLMASELAVGLPEGQMGNSEVGHMNIGAGRVVYQELVRINLALKNGDFEKEKVFQEMANYCLENNKPLHLLGLLSDGGVHSHIEHLKGILAALKKYNLPSVNIHVFTDGRDTDPNGGLEYIQELETFIQEKGTGKIVSVIGRYYSMDRDKRWERVKIAYDLLVNGTGTHFATATEALTASYQNHITDEFVKPCIIGSGAKIEADDAVFFYNYRTDRGRELTEVLTQQDNHEYNLHTLPLHYTTMTRYDEKFQGVNVIYEKAEMLNVLGEYLASKGKKQIRIAETEKYPHVTFFFNGGKETPFEGEKRILCPSPKVATYDLKPEMSAYDIRDAIIPELQTQEADFICLNFANPDMVGHTGVMEAAIQACEVVDACTKAVAEAALANGYNVLITADHGNADKMKNPDGSPHTAHTLALVPLVFLPYNNAFRLKQITGKLGDLAPTILTIMGIPVPEEMKGEILVEK